MDFTLTENSPTDMNQTIISKFDRSKEAGWQKSCVDLGLRFFGGHNLSFGVTFGSIARRLGSGG